MTNWIFGSCAALFYENQVLVQQRPEGKSLAGKWEFPGGKLEQGETFEAALVRELREELDIVLGTQDLEPLGFIESRQAHGDFMISVFKVNLKQLSIRALEGQAFSWFALDQLDNVDLIESNREIVKQLRKEL